MAKSGVHSLGGLHKSDPQILQLVRAADEMLMYRAISACRWNDTISGCGDIGHEP